MTARSTLSHWLFGLACGAAVLLVGLVVLCPLFVAPDAEPTDGRRIVWLFGHDPLVRRTTVASAVGLLVTAGVFFRGGTSRPGEPPPLPRRRSSRAPGA